MGIYFYRSEQEETEVIGGKLANKYDFVTKFDNGLYYVELNGKVGLVDPKGEKEIVPLKYDGIVDDEKDEFFRTYLDFVNYEDERTKVFTSKEGLLNKKNAKEIIKPKYDMIYPFNISGFAIVLLEEKYGLINKSGKEIIKPKYDMIYSFFVKGFNKVKVNNKYGFVNKKGIEIGEIKYEDVSNFKNGMALVKLNDKWGIINTKGKIIVPIQFNEIEDLKIDKHFKKITILNEKGEKAVFSIKTK